MICADDLDDLTLPTAPLLQPRPSTRPAPSTSAPANTRRRTNDGPGMPDTLFARLERMERLARLEDIARLNLFENDSTDPAQPGRRSRHQVMTNLAGYEPVMLADLRRRTRA